MSSGTSTLISSGPTLQRAPQPLKTAFKVFIIFCEIIMSGFGLVQILIEYLVLQPALIEDMVRYDVPGFTLSATHLRNPTTSWSITPTDSEWTTDSKTVKCRLHQAPRGQCSSLFSNNSNRVHKLNMTDSLAPQKSFSVLIYDVQPFQVTNKLILARASGPNDSIIKVDILSQSQWDERMFDVRVRFSLLAGIALIILISLIVLTWKFFP